VTIWTAGFGLPDLAARGVLRTDIAGRLLTDETLTSLDDVRVIVGGESSAPSDLAYRMCAHAAQPLGARAVDTVLSRSRATRPRPSMGGSSACALVGRRSATAQFARQDDTAASLTLSGRMVALLVKGGRHQGCPQAACARGTQARFAQCEAQGRRAPTAAAGQARPRVGNCRRRSLDSMSDRTTDLATEAFVAHRNLLFTVAYEMLGSAADAEDVLQETWLRWVKVDLEHVRDQRAYLVRITTRQSLNRLRTVRRRREAYVGPWLPEPMLTAPDVAEDAELAESVSMAMMLVLETLSPTERVVFVLRDVFDVSYLEIAATVDKSPAAVRQIAHRARQHVDARRPREVVSSNETRAILESFQRALESENLRGSARRARPGGRPDRRRGRSQAGCAAADHRRREGGSLHGRWYWPGPRRGCRAHRWSCDGQRQPGTRRTH